MVNFSKIFGLVGAVAVFTGLAYGQNQVCSNPVALPGPGLIRVEGTTELVADFQFTCTGGAAASINILDILSLPVTSKVLGTVGGVTYTEALAVVTNGGVTNTYQGVASGSQINFNGASGVNNGIPLAAGTTTITLTNVRVNASSLTVGTGTPPAVTESAFISGVGVTTAALSAIPVAFAFTGLRPVALSKTLGGSSGVNNFLVCQAAGRQSASPLGGIATFIDFGENFATAFKGATAIPPATNTTLESEFTNNTETGFIPPNGFQQTAGASNVASSPTEIQIVFTNVPANVTLYVPTTVAADQGAGAGTLTLVSAATGGTAVTPLSQTSTITAGTGQISISSGTGTAYYQFVPGMNSTNTTETFAVPLYVIAGSNTVAASTTAISAAVSFAPVGAAAGTIPNFVVGPSTVTQTLSTFSGCTTSLLFPFVSNQLGFDTGIAIANTSTDPFGTRGATPQAGTCTMSFYGNGAPSPATITTPSVPSGTVYTTVLSSIGAGFQGYIIAQCSFQYAHGFAFVEDGVGPTGGLSQGYLAGVIPDTNQVSRATANPIGSVVALGQGETLGN